MGQRASLSRPGQGLWKMKTPGMQNKIAAPHDGRRWQAPAILHVPSQLAGHPPPGVWWQQSGLPPLCTHRAEKPCSGIPTQPCMGTHSTLPLWKPPCTLNFHCGSRASVTRNSSVPRAERRSPPAAQGTWGPLSTCPTTLPSTQTPHAAFSPLATNSASDGTLPLCPPPWNFISLAPASAVLTAPTRELLHWNPANIWLQLPSLLMMTGQWGSQPHAADSLIKAKGARSASELQHLRWKLTCSEKSESPIPMYQFSKEWSNSVFI